MKSLLKFAVLALVGIAAAAPSAFAALKVGTRRPTSARRPTWPASRSRSISPTR